MFEESRTAFFRLREDDVAAGADWPLARLAESARLAGRAFGEPLLGTLEPGAPADLVVLDYAAPAPLDAASFAGHWVFGLSSRHVRDVMVAGEWVVLDRRLTRVDQDELAADGRAAGRAPVAPAGRDRRAHVRTEGRTVMAVTMRPRRALPAGQAPDPRRACATRSSPRSAGFEAVWQAESRLVREATVPMAAYAAVTERIAIGSGVVNNWTRNVGLLAATFSTLDDLAPGPRSGSGSAPGGSRSPRRSAIHRHQPARRRCARRSRRRGACSRWSGSPSTASSSTSTTSRSTSSTATARRSTCRSTSARPG